jgi:NhaP-type Na+/H+ or K+/H+ antiporter
VTYLLEFRRTLMKRIILAMFSPLVIGSVVGTLVPLVRYKAILGNSELHGGYRRQLLERLPQNIIIGCLAGLVLGILADWAIRRFKSAATLHEDTTQAG